MLIDFIKSYFAALGVLWLVFDIFNQFFPNTRSNVLFPVL